MKIQREGTPRFFFLFILLYLVSCLTISPSVFAHDNDDDDMDRCDSWHKTHLLTPDEATSLQPFTKDFALPAAFAVKSIAQDPKLWKDQRVRKLVLVAVDQEIFLLNKMDRRFEAVLQKMRPVELASVELRAEAAVFIGQFILAQSKYVVASQQVAKADIVYAVMAKTMVESMKATLTVATQIRDTTQNQYVAVTQAQATIDTLAKTQTEYQAVTTIVQQASAWQKTETVQAVAVKEQAAALKQTTDVVAVLTKATQAQQVKQNTVEVKLVAMMEMARVAQTNVTAITTQQAQATYSQAEKNISAIAATAIKIIRGDIAVGADLSLSGNGPTDVMVGDDANYAYTVTNLGPAAANDTQLSVDFSGEIVTTDPGCTADATRAGTHCLISTGPLPAGATVSIAIPSYWPLPGAYKITASLPADNDPKPQNNTVILNTNVAEAASGPAISFGNSPTEIRVGDEITYTVSISNKGRADMVAAETRLDFSSPDGSDVTIISATASQGDALVDRTGVTYTLGTVKSQATAVISVTYKANQTGTVVTAVTVSAQNYQATTSTLTTTVKEAAGVNITYSPNNPAVINEGETTAFVTEISTPAEVSAQTAIYTVKAVSPDNSAVVQVVTVKQDGVAIRQCTQGRDGSTACPISIAPNTQSVIETDTVATLNQGFTQGQMAVTTTVATSNGATSSATSNVINIQAAATTYTWSMNQYSVAENGRAVMVTANRSNASQAASVVVSTIDGTAKADKDYLPVSTTVNFAAGELSQNVSIGIIDNEISDGDRSFSVQMADANGKPLTPNATVTIVDNDVCTPAPENDAASCSDGKDNDCDGFVDCGDPDCTAFCDADLNVTAKPESLSASVGDKVIVTYHVINAGPASTTATFTSPILRGLTVLSVQSDKGDVCKTNTDAVICTLDMASVSFSDITVVKQYQVEGHFSEDAIVTSPLNDPNPNDNKITFTADVSPPEICNNGIDDNNNGLTDCADPACSTDPSCNIQLVEICGNGVDDDKNGLTDCADPACSTDPSCNIRLVEICGNGVDDDKNGLTDCADPACSTDPSCNIRLVEICGNGVDDDKNGLADCADPACFNDPSCNLTKGP
ncbi:MAG: Calx-beta domain-containing protein [bacterium]